MKLKKIMEYLLMLLRVSVGTILTVVGIILSIAIPVGIVLFFCGVNITWDLVWTVLFWVFVVSFAFPAILLVFYVAAMIMSLFDKLFNK